MNCSGLQYSYGLRRCLESHMDFLKEYEKSKMGTVSSVSEYENAASEKISSERSSALQRHLDRYDWMLMEQYYDCMILRHMASATQVQTIGVMLVGEALPMPVNPEVRTVPLIKRIQGNLRSGAALHRSSQWLALGTLATVTTVGVFSGVAVSFRGA